MLIVVTSPGRAKFGSQGREPLVSGCTMEEPWKGDTPFCYMKCRPPSGAHGLVFLHDQGLTPLATQCRPFGAEEVTRITTANMQHSRETYGTR